MRAFSIAIACVVALGASTPADAAGRPNGWRRLRSRIRGIARRTSVEVNGGITIAPPKLTHLGNVAVGASLWSGDVNFHQQRARYRDTHWNPRVQIATPVFSLTRNRLSGTNLSLNAIPFVGAYSSFSGRAYGISVGVPNYASLGLGKVRSTLSHEYARGSYLGVAGSAGVRGALRLSFGVTVFTPLLDPLTRPLEAPAARLRDLGERVKTRVATTWREGLTRGTRR